MRSTQQLAGVGGSTSSHEVPPVCLAVIFLKIEMEIFVRVLTTEAVQHFPLLATLGVTATVSSDTLSPHVSSTLQSTECPQVALMLLSIG